MATTNLKCTKCGYEAKDENDRKQHMEQKHPGEQAGSMSKKSDEDDDM